MQILILMCQSRNIFWKRAVKNVGCLFAYFWGGHKNNFWLLFQSLGVIHEVHTLKWTKFWHPPLLMYAIRQRNDVTKTIDVRFCPESSSILSCARTLLTAPYKNLGADALFQAILLDFRAECKAMKPIRDIQENWIYLVLNDRFNDVCTNSSGDYAH